MYMYVYIYILYAYLHLHLYLYLYMSWLWPGFQASYSPTLEISWPNSWSRGLFFASIKAPTTLHSQLVGALVDVEATRMLYKA